MRVSVRPSACVPRLLARVLFWVLLICVCPASGDCEERNAPSQDATRPGEALSLGGEQSDAVAVGKSRYFGIQAIDDQTGRGIPLVEFQTVHHVSFVTDSGGWIAVDEAEWMGQSVYFHVRSHGYEYPRDGFGNVGLTLTPRRGERVAVRLRRRNVAQRLYRVTGEGIYRDSLLLSEPCPLAVPEGTGQVLGQDSVQATVFRDRVYWFWGDTNRILYPLGHFWTSGATSALPARGGLDPLRGVDLQYFVDADGFSRPMARLDVERGPIWIDALCVLPDDQGERQLVCHYTHMESLDRMLDHGIAVYDPEAECFERRTAWGEQYRELYPGGSHALRTEEDLREWLYLGEVFPTVRFPASVVGVADPGNAQVWSCLERGSSPEEPRLLRLPDGRLDYAWRADVSPVGAQCEWRWIRNGTITQSDAHFVPLDVDTQKPVLLHRGTVNWNPHRGKWIMIAGQQGGDSYLGEIWYAESDELMGPWQRAKKIVTHEKYSFYNPVQHAFFDQEGGRLIYFEGTYTVTFSGNAVPTPRYDYNQIMYRLDLDDPRLEAVR